MAFNFILGSASVVQYALLQKSLDFRSRFWIEAIAVSISGIIALVLALVGAGVWSLAVQSLCVKRNPDRDNMAAIVLAAATQI